jgi:hypothetical protein
VQSPVFPPPVALSTPVLVRSIFASPTLTTNRNGIRCCGVRACAGMVLFLSREVREAQHLSLLNVMGHLVSLCAACLEFMMCWEGWW